MSAAPLGVLLIGATGVFGRRLAEGLAREPGIALILAGRTAASHDRLKRASAGATEAAVLDRERVVADDLRGLAVDVAIDAAARAASTLVLYGVSSTTALSHAVLDRLGPHPRVRIPPPRPLPRLPLRDAGPGTPGRELPAARRPRVRCRP
jgi:N-acetyl-gamma-glutamylphosphate reductase